MTTPDGGELLRRGGGIPADLAERIRLVVLDVDGVLTDGGVLLGATPAGETVEIKRFDIQDGLGIKMLQQAGIVVTVVSGRPSPATSLRARELEIEEVHQEAGGYKLPLVEDLLERHGVGWEEVAMMADDLADLPVFRKVGLPVSVANAVPEIAAAARWSCPLEGGNGAVRAFSQALLGARDEWDRQVEAYVRARGG